MAANTKRLTRDIARYLDSVQKGEDRCKVQHVGNKPEDVHDSSSNLIFKLIIINKNVNWTLLGFPTAIQRLLEQAIRLPTAHAVQLDYGDPSLRQNALLLRTCRHQRCRL